MRARLFCKTGQLNGAEFEIDREATIGSKPGNTIELYPKIISGKHARIVLDEDTNCYYLEDLGSSNGTHLDGVRVKNREKLGRLHVITFAHTLDFLFQVLDKTARETGATQPESDTSEAPKTVLEEDVVPPPDIADTPKESDSQKTVFDDGAMPVPDLQQQDDRGADDADQDKTVMVDEFVEPPDLKQDEPVGKPVLRFAHTDEVYELREGEQTVGRAMECEVTLEHPSMSRRHASITIDKNKITVKDLGSKNHTFVDDKKIEAPVTVSPKTKIRFGDIEATIELED